MSKRLILLEHGENEGDRLTPGGLAKIIEYFSQEIISAPFRSVSDVFHSFFYRSLQTLQAVIATVGIRARVHAPISQLGNGPWMGEIFTAEFEALLETGLPMIPAMIQFHGETKVAQWFMDVKEGINIAFASMKGNLGLAVGHNPMIPMVVMVLRGGNYQSFEKLESIIIEQDDDGTLRIVE